MGTLVKITMREGERMEGALRVLSDLAAEGRVHSLLFVAQIDEDDETSGAFGDYSDPEGLVVLTTRLSLRAQQGLLRSTRRRKAGVVRPYKQTTPAG